MDLRFAAGSGRGVNTWHFRTDNPIGIEDEASTIMGWVKSFYTSAFALVPAASSASWSGQIAEVGVTEPSFTPPRTGWSVTGGASATTYTGAASMACVTWRSSVATRSGRGRTFVGPLDPSAVQSDGTLSTTALTAIRTAAGNLVSQSNTNDGVGALVVYSELQNIARDFIAASVTDQVAVLRSRR